MHPKSASRAVGIAALMLAAFCGSAAAAITDHSLSFDGVAQFVTVNDPVQITDGPFSIESWIWVSSLTGHQMILSNRDGVSNGYGLYVYPGVGDALSMGLVLNGALVSFDEVGANIQEWVHVAVTWGGVASGEIKLYGNGQLLHTYNYTTPIGESPGNLRIGMWVWMDFFAGYIDDLRIWSVALDQQTIETWRWKPVDATHPNWSDLKAYWKFDEGSGQTAASEVNSPAYDGTLGETGSEESSDPLWSDVVSPVPVERTTVGRLKWGWRNSER